MRKTISRREWLAVLALLLLAFALRTHALTTVPYGLHIDELANVEMTETVTQGRFVIFFPENIGNEALYFYFAAPLMSLLGKSIVALRMMPIFSSMVAMCVIWALTRRLFGPIAALTALAGFAVTFWTLLTGRLLVRAIFEVPMAALAVYWFWRARDTSGRRTWFYFALSGLFTGLAIETYIASRAFPVIFAVFGGYVLLAHRAEWRYWRKGLALVLAVTAIVALPLVIYLSQNTDGGKLSFFNINLPLLELGQGNPRPLLENIVNVLGMFAFVGDPLPYYAVPNRPFLDPISALLLLAGVLIAVRRWRQPKYAFVGLWLGLTLVPSMLSFPAPNSVRTIGAQVVVFTLIGVAVAEVVKRWPRRPVYAGLALLLLGNVVWTARDYFVTWPALNEVRFWQQSGLRGVADAVQRDPADSPVAVCVPDHLIDERERWWEPAWRLMRFLLDRPELALRYYNCVDVLVLPDGPARYAFPDAADEATLEQFPIYQQFLRAAASDRVTLPDRLGQILTVDRAATPLDQQLADMAQNKVFYEGGTAAVQRPIDLGGQIGFIGYTQSRAGNELTLTTYWRVTAQLPPQLSQFTHVLNDKDEIVTQADRLMVTSQSLQAGDVVAQIHRLALPDKLGAGSYRIAIGLYTQSDGKRLTVMDNGQPRGDRLFIGD